MKTCFQAVVLFLASFFNFVVEGAQYLAMMSSSITLRSSKPLPSAQIEEIVRIAQGFFEEVEISSDFYSPMD